MLSIFTVDSFGDTVDADPGDGFAEDITGNTTLRAAVMEANALAGDHTIFLPEGAYTFSVAGRDEDAAATGDLDITDNLTIIGDGADVTIIDGARLDRVFQVLPGITVTLSGVTITNGDASSTIFGGGIWNDGTLTIQECTVSNNLAGGGAGISNSGTLTITRSTFSGNATTGISGDGGAIFSDGTLAITNSTLSGNWVEDSGSAIRTNGGFTTLVNCTVVSTDDRTVIVRIGDGTLDVQNSIIIGETLNITDLGGNVFSDPGLGPLQDNGGPTLTHALLPGSAAIDAGIGAGAPAFDQRGVARPQDGDLNGTAVVDIGAFEVSHFVVTSALDTVDANDGITTLREAIGAANAHAGTDTIAFNISGAGPHAIQPTSALPTITDPVVIDGYTQPGAAANTNPAGSGLNTVLMIELDGSNVPNNGLTISAGNSTVRGLVINRFVSATGIYISGSGGNVIQGNFIGTDATGTTGLANEFGLQIRNSADNLVGGAVPGARNVISGNTRDGVVIAFSSATGNKVKGNFIGIDVTGTSALGNAFGGVAFAGVRILSASDNTIGGTSAGQGNVISGNARHGVEIQNAAGNFVQGNLIGTDVTGRLDVGNSQSGVSIIDGAADNTVGGTVTGAGNVISGNNGDGIGIRSANGNQVQGNLIGTDVTGTAAVGNNEQGIDINNAHNNLIGGTIPEARNVISGSFSAAIQIVGGATGNRVQGNFIGTQIDGVSPLGNLQPGVFIDASDNTIGGSSAGAGNTIAFYGRGVVVVSGDGNAIQGNSIFSNINLGIDLLLPWDFGVTLNDPGDGDVGPNDFQNFPVLIAGYSGAGGTVVDGTLDSTANTTFDLDFYSSTVADPSGFGEGETFLGSATVMTDASGNASFRATLDAVVEAANVLTATATDASGNTSEFSAALPVSSALVVNSLDDVDDGVFSFTHASLREAINLANATPGMDTIAFNISGDGPHTIQPTSALPTITDPVIIDGYTQPGAAANTNPVGSGLNTVLMIELDGSNAGSDTDGLQVSAGSSTIRGLAINGFSGNGIQLISSGNVIQGNFIGTDVTGMVGLANAQAGLRLSGNVGDTSNNLIGGTTPASRNVISGNALQGVLMLGMGASGNILQGNFVGTAADGVTDLGNSAEGVRIQSGAAENMIGGTTAEARNVISGNDLDGIEISYGATRNLVHGNYIGTDATGTVALGNVLVGVLIFDSPNNTVGGSVVGAGNLISSNGTGIHIWYAGSTENLVAGNFIGTDVSGTAALGNRTNGVRIYGAPHNTIGGTEPGAGNVISGNDSRGVEISESGATGNVVQGNFIGTNLTGTAELGNARDGVYVYRSASNTTIGGTTPGAGNVISGNAWAGIDIWASGTLVQGNLIGTNSTGMAALGNHKSGMSIGEPDCTVGGTESGAGNVISGNYDAGINLTYADRTVIQGNFIGTDVSRTVDLGNAVGVRIIAGANDNLIGGEAGGGNTIAFNKSRGSYVGDGAGIVVENSTGNAIRCNSIFSNVNLGIDLIEAGVTPNDPGDGDTGANNLQNFPVLIAGYSGAGGTVVDGTLDSTANTTFDLDFYSSTVPDPSGFGEGETFLGSATVMTDASGNASFRATLDAVVAAGHVLTATATDASGNTSEFSAALAVTTALVVNTSDDVDDGVFSFTHASLREAISLANATPGMDTIAFNISGDGPHAIQPTSALPTITDPVIIDGYTQPGSSPNTNDTGLGLNTVLMVELDGSSVSNNGLTISAGNSTVRGVVVNRFANGIVVHTNGGNQIEGNFIGTDVFGTSALGNSSTGVTIASGSDNNTVGGVSPSQRNVISGNGHSGVMIDVASGNLVQGNFIGLDATGQVDLGNNQTGVLLRGGANNVVGGVVAGARNIISGNGRGVEIKAIGSDVPTGNEVRGNYIGVDVSGALDRGNTLWGILISAGTGNTLADNVVSGNDHHGIEISNSDANIVTGNIVGMNAAGDAALGNALDGIHVSFGFSSSGNSIGGTSAGEGNVIAFNGGDGVAIGATTVRGDGVDVGPGTGNAILGNSIFANGGLGIDLQGGDGVTPNDPGDTDTGGNNLQNSPTIASAVSDAGNTVIEGTLHSTAGTTFTVELFSNQLAEPSGYGEGETFLHSASVTTDASGDASFSVTVLNALVVGDYITATATGPDGTSEFSQAVDISTVLHWQGDVDNNWSTPGNWLEDEIPVDDDSLVFDNNTSGFADNFTPSNDLTGFSVHQIHIIDDSAAGNFVIAGNAISLHAGLYTSGTAGEASIALDAVALTASQVFDLGLHTVITSPLNADTPGAAPDLTVLAGAGTVQLAGMGTIASKELGNLLITSAGTVLLEGPIVADAGDIDITAKTVQVGAGISTGSGSVTLSAAQNIVLNSGSSLITVDGGITLNANTNGTTLGDFVGVDLNGATIESTSGAISLVGHGGDVGTRKYGVQLFASTIRSLGVGPAAATISIAGTSGTGLGSDNKQGVYLSFGSMITSVDGDIQVSGLGGDWPSSGNSGVSFSNSVIESTGVGNDAATITIDGTGGHGTVYNTGIYLYGAGSSVTSVDGDISLIGTGGSGNDSHGVWVRNGAVVQSTGTGASAATITINGDGGDGQHGVAVTGVDSQVLSAAGAVDIDGVGVGASGVGLFVDAGGGLDAGGPVTVTADKMNLQGTITAPGQIVTLQPWEENEAIDLGSVTDVALDTLELSDAELDNITADVLRVGSSNVKSIMVSAVDVGPDNVATDFSLLANWGLYSNGGVGTIAFDGGLRVDVLNAGVHLSGANDINTFSAHSGGGNIQFANVDGFTVGTVDGQHGTYNAGGVVMLTANAGDVTINNTAATNDIEALGAISITLQGDGAKLTIATDANLESSSANTHSFTADKMQILGTITTPNGPVLLRSYNAGEGIDLGSATDDATDTLELSDTELDSITADVLRIGETGAGPITISSFISPAGTGTLHLISGGEVGIAYTKGITVGNLAVEAGGTVNLSNNSSNLVDTIAITTPGVVFFDNNVGFTVGELDGVAGIAGSGMLRAVSGDLLISDTSAGDDIRANSTFGIILNGDEATLSLASGARIFASAQSYSADKMDLQGTIISRSSVLLKPKEAGEAINLGATGDTTPDTLELSDAELDNITADVLRVGSSNVRSIMVSAVDVGPDNVATAFSLLADWGIYSGGGAGTITFAGGLWCDGRAAGVHLSGANDVDTFAAASDNSVRFTDMDGFTVGTVDGGTGIDVKDWGVWLTASNGDVTVSDTSAENDIEAGGAITIRLEGDGAKLTVEAGADVESSGVLSHDFTADKMDLSGTITAPGQTVTLQPFHADEAIDLGPATDDATDTLELSDAELDNVTAGVLRIGNGDAGTIAISSAISPAGTDTLHLISDHNVGQSAAIQETNLAVEAGGIVGLYGANQVDTLAILTTMGTLSFTEYGGFTVGSVDGVEGVRGPGWVLLSGNPGASGDGSITVSADIQGGTVDLVSDGVLTIEAGANVESTIGGQYSLLKADKMVISGTVTAPADKKVWMLPRWSVAIDLGSTTDAGDALELSDAELDRITAGVLWIGSSNAGAIDISAPIDPAGTDTLHLASGGAVTQLGSITVASLAVQAEGAITLTDGANEVSALAAHSASNNVDYFDANGFTVTTVDTVSGVRAGSGALRLNAFSGDVTIEESMDAPAVEATGSVVINLLGEGGLLTVASGATLHSGRSQDHRADRIDLQGTIEAGSESVQLRPSSADWTIDLGSTADNSANALELSDGELDRVTAGLLRIGTSSTGAIDITTGIDPAGTDTLHLTSGGAVTQSGNITVANLAVQAEGSVGLGRPWNDFGTVAASSATGGVELQDFNGFAVGSVGDVHGVQATGNVGLSAQSGNLTVRNTAASEDVGATSFTARVWGDEATVEAEPGSHMAASNMASVVADKMKLAGTIAGHYVDLLPLERGQTVDLGSQTDDAPDTVELSDDELSGITAAHLRIGRWSGAVMVSAAVGAEGAGLLWLFSDGGISQTAAINQSILVAEADGAVLLDAANDVDTLILKTTTGDISFTDLDGFQAFRWDGKPAISAPNGSVSLSALNGDMDLAISATVIALEALGPVSISLEGDNAAFTLASNATLTCTGEVSVTADRMDLAGKIETAAALRVQPFHSGTGDYVLSGTVNATEVVVDEGTLRLGAAERLTDNAAVVLVTPGQAVLDLNGFDETIGSLAGQGNVSLGSGTLTTGGNNATTTYHGVISGSGGVVKQGTGSFAVGGDNTYAGATDIAAGTLLVEGSLSTGPVTVDGGATLGGAGTIGGLVTVQSGGSIAPGGADPGVLTTRGVALTAGSALAVELNGTTPGSQYDQLAVNGTVDLGGATLEVTLGFVPASSDDFLIVDNDGTEPVTGTFDGLPEGAIVTLGGKSYRLTYEGGDGNNVMLAPGFLVSTTNDAGPGSLRQAILDANAQPGTDVIVFDVGAGGVQTIRPLSALPVIADPVIIDGTTQPGFAGMPIIELDGSSAGSGTDGLNVTAGNSTVRGLVINRFLRSGIQITINGGNVIEGNFIGTDVNGTADLGNRYGVRLDSSTGNTIGGTAIGAGNVISGNDSAGVFVHGGEGNTLQGNLIGTDVTGTADVGNSSVGVYLFYTTANTIGGAAVAARNVISGNDHWGVEIYAGQGNEVEGNFIGTDVSGTADLGNSYYGVLVNHTVDNAIGGTTAGAGNVISGNDWLGVWISGGEGNRLQGNFIGTDVTGTADLGNGDGVYLTGTGANTIGGTTAAARNVISGNDSIGGDIRGADGYTLLGNFIGTDVTGTADLGNRCGVRLSSAASNTIGGTTDGAGNVISGNDSYGVFIYGGEGNTLQGNLIGTDVTGTADLGNNWTFAFLQTALAK